MSRLAVSFVMICSFIFLTSAMNAHAGSGQAKVEAAKAKGLPVFVDFGKTSCKPCKMMVPVLDALTKKYAGRMEVVFVHVDEEKDYTMKMGATMIPTQILIDKNGKEVSRHVGYIPLEDCEKMIGKTVPAAPAKAAAPAKGKAARKAASAENCDTGKTCTPGKVCK